jgi:glycine cleavage system H protein
MKFPSDKKYYGDQYWVLVEGDTATVGVTAVLAETLQDLVFVQLPKPGDSLKRDGHLMTVEGSKATMDLLSPLTGRVLEANQEVFQNPALLNTKPYDSWVVRLGELEASELESLKSSDQLG